MAAWGHSVLPEAEARCWELETDLGCPSGQALHQSCCGLEQLDPRCWELETDLGCPSGQAPHQSCCGLEQTGP